MQSMQSAASIQTDLLTMQPQPSQNLIMTSNKKKKYPHQAPPPKQPHQHNQQFQINKTFNVVSILKTSQQNPQQHQQTQPLPQSYANVVNRSMQPILCNGNMVAVNNCQMNSDTAMYSINHRIVNNNSNNNMIDSNAHVSTGFVNSPDVGGSTASGSSIGGGGSTNIIALNSSSSHGGNAIGISIGAPTGTYSHDKSIVNVACVDNRKYDFKNTKLMTNNNFQATQEYVPPTGANNTGNVRSGQQGGNILRGHAGNGPRGSRPQHIIYPPLSQGMVIPPYAQYGPRQPAFQPPQFSFQQPLQPNFYQFHQYYPTIPAQPHQRGAVSSGPNGQLATATGAAQAQIPLTPVIGPVGTGSGAVMGVSASPTGQQVNMQMVNVVPQQVAPPQQMPRARRRTHCLEIIDPLTKKNILDEVELAKNATHSESDCIDVNAVPNVQGELPINVSQDSNMGILNANVNEPRGSIPYNLGDVHQIHPRDAGTGQTPVVSAMSDGPSVEILPNSNPKPRTKKILPILPPKDVVENKSSIQHLAKGNASEVPLNVEPNGSPQQQQQPQPPPPQITAATVPVQSPSDNIEEQHSIKCIPSYTEPLQKPTESATTPVPETETINISPPETLEADAEKDRPASPDVPAAAAETQNVKNLEDPNVNGGVAQQLSKMQITEKEISECKSNNVLTNKSSVECVAKEEPSIENVSNEYLQSNNNNVDINKDQVYDDTVTCDETDRVVPRESYPDCKMESVDSVVDKPPAKSNESRAEAVEKDDDDDVENANATPQAAADTATAASEENLITYNEGQWSPSNPTGKKQYARDQLLQLRDAKASRIQPNVKNISIMPQPNLMPSFARGNNNKRGGSMVGMVGSMGGGRDSSNFVNKPASMSGIHGRGSMKGDKGMIRVNLSLNQDVKLSETDNAWRPRVLGKSKEPEEEPQAKAKREKTELIRRVRGILNKLTPEKFDTLVEEIIKLKIDTTDKMEDVMVLVFEKAIDEPNFSVSYARLCHRLITEAKTRDEKTESGTKTYLTHFRNALIDKTEREFTQNVSKSEAKEKKLQPIIEKIKKCADPAEKAEMTAMLEEEERKIRRRSGGTVRFIGELFKISMLTGKIIQYCIEQLLQKDSEDKLECLCKLLTTVGAKYEQTPLNSKDPGSCYSLESKIAQMQAIASKTEDTKISSRVRFMLQDVIDLRKNKWQSTRNEAPKTMGQIEKETKSEQLSSQYLNYGGGGGGMSGSSGSSMGAGKREDRNSRYGDGSRSGSGYGGSHSQRGDARDRRQGNNSNNANNSGGGHSSNNNDGDTWHVQTGKGGRSQAVDTNKLEGLLNQNLDTKKMGGVQQFQQFWNRQSATPTTTPSNSFAALSSLVDINKGDRSGPRNKGSYSKNSMEKDRYGDRGSGMLSRTGSSQASRENSSSRSGQAVRGIMNSSSMQKSASHSKYTQQMPSSRMSGKQPSGVSSNPFSNHRSEQGFNSEQSGSSSAFPNMPPPAVFVEPTDSDLKFIKSMVSDLIETVASSKTIKSIVPLISEIKENQLCGLIYYLLTDYLHLAQVGKVHRRYLANIIIYCIKHKFMSVDHIKVAYKEFCSIASDLIVDIPELWLYIFEFTGPLMVNKLIKINDLWIKQLKEDSAPSFGQKFLKTFLLYCTREIGPGFIRSVWKEHDMKWTDFMPESEVENFIKTNNFEYIENEGIPFRIEVKEPKDKHVARVVDHIELMLEEESNGDSIIDYINGNLSEVDKNFIRSLTEKLCNFAIAYKDKSYKLNAECFQKVCIPVLHRYLDSNEDQELECLYTMQLLVASMEHPRGLLCELFAELYENYVIPLDSFIKWRDSKDQSAGKGVAVKGLNPFFNHILSGEMSDENN